MSNFWTVWLLKTELLKTEYEQNFGFPHIPNDHDNDDHRET